MMKQQLIEDLKNILPIHNWAYWGNTRIAVTQKWDYEAIATKLEDLGYIHQDDIHQERGEKR
jgi:glycogen synthase